MFKDLRPGYPVYVFDRKAIAASQGKIVRVSEPYCETPKQETSFSMPVAQSTQRVVDVTIEREGRTATFVICENLEVAYAGDLTISTNKAGITREIEVLKVQSQEAVASVEHHKAVIEKCTDLLGEWDTDYRDRAATEKRLAGVEDSVRNIEKLLKELTATKE